MFHEGAFADSEDRRVTCNELMSSFTERTMMPTLKTVLSCSITGMIFLNLSGCNKPQDVAGANPPSISVGATIDDAVIATKVNAALLGNNAVKAYDIKVSVRKGEVMLSGFVDDQTQIDQSIAIARAVEGVQNVTNEMMIKSGSRTIGNKVDDGVITAKLKSAILNDATINSLDISIVTSKGDVLLSGFVDSETQITRATELASSVEGVTKVTNKMSLKR